jgi:hypothetical protein
VKGVLFASRPTAAASTQKIREYLCYASSL